MGESAYIIFSILLVVGTVLVAFGAIKLQRKRDEEIGKFKINS